MKWSHEKQDISIVSKIEGHFYKIADQYSQKCQGHWKTKEDWETQILEKTEEIWQLNTMCNDGLDSGIEKQH